MRLHRSIRYDWHVSMVDIHFRNILWVYCPGHAGVKGNDRADRLAGKATVTDGLRLGRSEVLRSLTETLPAVTKPRPSHHQSPGGERRTKRKRLKIFTERERKGHRQSDPH